MNPEFLIFGSDGQVGKALQTSLHANGFRFAALSRKECDLAIPGLAASRLQEWRPRFVFLAGAYTKVDQAEEEEVLALRVNAEAPSEIAETCMRLQIPLLHYSTDYVFSGEGSKPWTEEDATHPLSAYGRTKLAGENAVLESRARAWVFRTSWVYDGTGRNFVNTIRKLAGEREELKIVADQVGAPTFAGDLAHASVELALQALSNPTLPTGVFHAANLGETSWFGFGEMILRKMKERGDPVKAKLLPIPSSEYPTRAKRPLNSRLNTEKIKDLLQITLPSWEEGFKRCTVDWK